MHCDAETLEDWEHNGFVRFTSKVEASALSDLREFVDYLKRSADAP